MKNLTSNEIRTMWLSFFESKSHTILKGASLIPQNDKTLLWINSGVAALKQYFDGSKIATDRRITNVQKSIRTNDIENVGKTNRHHTFFEMLGNFSIGDYFRKEAIIWGFEFLTSPKWLGLELDKLYITYHTHDLETKKLWESFGVSPTHLIPLDSNFWEIGEGPCGPNTEIFFDLGEHLDPLKKGADLLREDIDNDRFLEIWNIVFSQYNAKAGVKREDYEELPRKNIDTGAGLERIASVLQQTPSNYETDLFAPLNARLEALTKTKYNDHKMSYRVIDDHIRTCTFALSDGANFSNEGRGYVLRRLLRRASRFGKKIGLNEPFLYTLVKTVVEIMAPFYPELNDNVNKVEKLIKSEEERFLKTLEHGEALLRKEIAGQKELSGEVAFKLYDTYGFPFEITKEIGEEEGVSVDEKGYYTLLEKQKELARKARNVNGTMNTQSQDLLNFNNQSIFEENTPKLVAKVSGIFKDGVLVNSVEESGALIFEKTPFYSESGGQISDEGVIYNDNFLATVTSMAKAPHGQNMHFVEVQYGKLFVGEEVTLEINKVSRSKISQNHSATHFLQSALNEIVSKDIAQAGSYVGPYYLRFDFTHPERISRDLLLKVEERVNEYIAEAIPLEIKFMKLDEAKALGAKALFLDKYGDLVRVVIFGEVSRELCGGTHVKNSRDIGTFALVSEGSVASGVRRITAVTGLDAYHSLKKSEGVLQNLASLTNSREISDVSSNVKKLISENESLKAEYNVLKDEQIKNAAFALEKKTINNFNVYIAVYEQFNRNDLARISDYIKSKDSKALTLLVSNKKGEEGSFVLNVNTSLHQNINSRTIISKIKETLAINGGGRPDFASGKLSGEYHLEQLTKAIKGLLNA